MNPYPTRHSGFYKIRARMIDKYGNYGYALLHRGKSLPKLEKMNGIIEYMFTRAAIAKMEKDKVMRAYSLGYLCDLFTQEEVERVISCMPSELMSITIEPVLRQSYAVGVAEIYMPHDKNRVSLSTPEQDLFHGTVNWSDKPFDFF